MDRKAICVICGKQFEARAANSKYCSIGCRRKGKYQRRKDWEDRSGYREKQRKKMQEYREKAAAEALEEREATARQEAADRKQKETQRRNQEREELIQKAEQGDAFSRMMLAAEKAGKTSLEYWDAYKDYEMQSAARLGKISTTSVNGISVHDPDFGLAVSISVVELGHIAIKAGSIAGRTGSDEKNNNM